MARNELELGELERAAKRAGDARGSSVMPKKDTRVITNQELYAPTYQAIGDIARSIGAGLSSLRIGKELDRGGKEAQAMASKGNYAGAIGRTIQSGGNVIAGGYQDIVRGLAYLGEPMADVGGRFFDGIAGSGVPDVTPNFSNVKAGSSSKAMSVPAAGANEAAMRDQESNVNAVAAGYNPPMVQGIAAPRPANIPASGRPFEFNGQIGYEVTHPGYTTGETQDIPEATMQAVNRGIANRKDSGDMGFDANMIKQGIGIGRTTGKDGSVSYSDQTNRYANTDFGKQQIANAKDAESKRMKDVIQERYDRQTAMALDGVYGQKAREQAIAQTQNAQANQIQTDAAALSLKQAQDMDAMRIELAKAMDTGDEAAAKKIVAKINALTGKPAGGANDRYKIVMQKNPVGENGMDGGETAYLLDTATGMTSPVNKQADQAKQKTMPASDFKQFMQEQGMTREKALEFLNQRGFTIKE